MDERPPPETRATDASRRRVLTWLWRLPVLAVLVGAGYGVYEAVRILSKEAPGETPEFAPQPPQRVASLSTFSEVWSAAEFSFAERPAIAVRLPGLVSGGLSLEDRHYAAFSRVCTHQGCTVSLNKNLEAVAVAFNYRSSQPVLTCPCHFSVFDPAQAGEAVSGPAVRPLRRVRLEQRGDELYAVGLEVS